MTQSASSSIDPGHRYASVPGNDGAPCDGPVRRSDSAARQSFPTAWLVMIGPRVDVLVGLSGCRKQFQQRGGHGIGALAWHEMPHAGHDPAGNQPLERGLLGGR